MAQDDFQNRERSDLFSTTHWSMVLAVQDAIEKPESWNSPAAMIFIAGRKRGFAEESLSDSLNPSQEEIRRANEDLEPVVNNSAIDMTGHRWFPIAAGIGHALFLLPLSLVLLAVLSPVTGTMTACIIGGELLLALIVGSLWLPGRSLQDRIAGTCLLPQ